MLAEENTALTSKKNENIPTILQIYGLVATDILLIFYTYFLAHQAYNIRSVINGVSVCICS
jgi:hypothetical protein